MVDDIDIDKGKGYEDGTDRLCKVLYGEIKASHYLGGSQAKMLYDAADRIEELQEKLRLYQETEGAGAGERT